MGLITGVTLKPEIKDEDDKDWEGTTCEITEEIDASAPWFEFVLKLPNGDSYVYYENAETSSFKKVTAEEIAERDSKRKAEIEEARKHPLRDKYQF